MMRKRLLAVLLAMLPAMAQAFPIEVNMENHGLDIEAVPVRVAWGAVIQIRNNEPLATRCRVDFRNGPERKRRSAVIPSGESVSVQYQAQREVVRLRVTVDCLPVDA